MPQISDDRVIAVHELGHGLALLCYDDLSRIEMHAPENRNNVKYPISARAKSSNQSPEQSYVVAMAGPKAGLRIATLEGLTPSSDGELASDHEIARKALEDLGFESTNLEHFNLDKKIEAILDTYWDVILKFSRILIDELNVYPEDILSFISLKGFPDPRNWKDSDKQTT